MTKRQRMQANLHIDLKKVNRLYAKYHGREHYYNVGCDETPRCIPVVEPAPTEEAKNIYQNLPAQSVRIGNSCEEVSESKGESVSGNTWAWTCSDCGKEYHGCACPKISGCPGQSAHASGSKPDTGNSAAPQEGRQPDSNYTEALEIARRVREAHDLAENENHQFPVAWSFHDSLLLAQAVEGLHRELAHMKMATDKWRENYGHENRKNGDLQATVASLTSIEGDAPYKVEIDIDGCRECGCGKSWAIVGPGDVQRSTTYGDIDEAGYIADEMNEAFSLGKSQAMAERDRLREALAEATKPDMFWDNDNPEDMIQDPYDFLVEMQFPAVVRFDQAHALPPTYGFMIGEDEFYFSSKEEAESELSKKLAALEGTEGSK
jgi:hypothetical protein